MKEIANTPDSYRALHHEIVRPDRGYPILIVSPDKNEQYNVNSVHLQDSLTGLAQVVKLSKDMDVELTRSIIGDQWCAWDGAVNLVHKPIRDGYVRSRYFLPPQIEAWGSTNHDRVSNLLAWVTNTTNIEQLRQRISPEGVSQAAIIRKIRETQRQTSAMGVDELRVELVNAYKQIDELQEIYEKIEDEKNEIEEVFDQLSSELDARNLEADKLKHANKGLKYQLNSSGIRKNDGGDIEKLLRLACRKSQPTPEECLEVVEELYADHIVVLESAVKSAQSANAFTEGGRLLDMLRKLATEYRDALIESGDNEARSIFGKNEYAAKESETVMGSKSMRRARTFEYEGSEVQMMRHLKIGSADDPTKTIRIHFHWDAEKSLIVLGYCGKHLPVSGT